VSEILQRKHLVDKEPINQKRGRLDISSTSSSSSSSSPSSSSAQTSSIQTQSSSDSPQAKRTNAPTLSQNVPNRLQFHWFAQTFTLYPGSDNNGRK